MDYYLMIHCQIANTYLKNTHYDIPNLYAKGISRLVPGWTMDELSGDEIVTLFDEYIPALIPAMTVELNAARLQPVKFATLERTSSTPRDFKQLIPEPIVAVVHINGEPVRVLLDSGSLADFMSAKIAHQLKVKTFELEKPLPVQLAVQGSRAKINYGCSVQFSYQNINERRYFDITNLLSYDLILGTPFLFQHQVTLGFNPLAVLVGSKEQLFIHGKHVRVLESRAADLLIENIDHLREQLRQYAAPICTDTSDSPLPPLREINHSIPLIDTTKVYSWCPVKCLDAHRESWIEKRDAYLKSGRWKMTNARNTSPMLLLTKPSTGVKGVPPRLRMVCDLRERNANTHKLTSPLPDMESILCRVSRKPYRSLIDGKDSYKQICVIPEHVNRPAMTTPDGNMVSLVLQQGDCNAIATYQSLMNHIFGPFISVFMDVYLDNIILYSDSISEHVRHVKIVIDVLRRESLFLSTSKLHFLCVTLKILGRLVDNDGIRMDPDKVDSVVNWKVPTSKELLQGFLGLVGYLANDIAMVRIPMGILTAITGSESQFRWDHLHQRAFDEVKKLTQAYQEHHRKPLDYSPTAPRIWLITDGSLGGIAGVVNQGGTFNTGLVTAFYSAKLTSAQQNYPVHEIEMLAGVELIRRHRDILLGCHFTWVTNHKGLTHLMTQRNLSG